MLEEVQACLQPFEVHTTSIEQQFIVFVILNVPTGTFVL